MKKSLLYLSVYSVALLVTCLPYAAIAQTFSSPSTATFPVLGATPRFVTGDFDNDGDADILYQTAGNGSAFQYARSNSNGTFTILALAASPFTGLTLPDFTIINYHVGDIDGDGDKDLWAVPNGTTGSYFRNDGSTFSSQPTTTFPAPGAGSRVVLADFDNDGDADIFYQTGGNGTAFQYALSNANGTYTIVAQAASPFAGLTLPDFSPAGSYSAADFDGDIDIDLYCCVAAATGSYFRNNGNGTFSSLTTASFPVPSVASRYCAGDFDSDGDADILYQTGANGTAFQYARSNGDGTFTIVAQGASPFAGLALIDHTGSTSLNYRAADLDGDGDADIYAVVGSATGNYYMQNDRPPYIAASNPADNQGAVYRDANIVLTFNESVSKGTGNIYIVQVTGNTIAETIPVTDARVTGSGTTWTINPSMTLLANTAYAIRADRKIFTDATSAIFFGISNNTALNFVTGTVLPVHLVSFSAQKQNNSVLLQWQTANEQDTREYIIEYSADGNNWNKIGAIAAAGNNAGVLYYDFVHLQPRNGINYYRLKQVDIDGKYTYSALKSVSFSNKNSITIQQNPVVNNQLVLNITKPVTLSIYANTGKLVYRKQYGAGNEIISVTNWAKGQYYLQVDKETVPFLIQ